MELLDWLLACGCSVASIVATLLLIPASRLATPTVVNMVRSINNNNNYYYLIIIII